MQHVISIPSNSDVYRAYYQSREFTVLSDAYAIRWKNKAETISSSQYLFMVMCINKITDLPIYSYKNKLGGWNVVKNKPIMLPVKNEKIDFKFMDDFIAELEAYLSVTGLKDTQLTKKEKFALENYDSLTWKEFNLEELFGKATRGKRLKSADMEDWKTKLDAFLRFNDADVLQDKGKVTAAIAKEFAESEFEKYRVIQDSLYESDFDKLMNDMEKNDAIH